MQTMGKCVSMYFCNNFCAIDSVRPALILMFERLKKRKTFSPLLKVVFVVYDLKILWDKSDPKPGHSLSNQNAKEFC